MTVAGKFKWDPASPCCILPADGKNQGVQSSLKGEEPNAGESIEDA